MKILICLSSETESNAMQRQLCDFGFVADVVPKHMLVYRVRTASYDALILTGGKRTAPLFEQVRRAVPKLPALLCFDSPLTQHMIHDTTLVDVIRKPFSSREVIGKLLLLGHEHELRASLLRCGDVMLDVSTKRVLKGDREIKLSKKEFQLLEFLLRNKNNVVTRAQIHDFVWETDEDPMANAIEVHISRLRKKLGNGSNAIPIETAHGFGYILRG